MTRRQRSAILLALAAVNAVLVLALVQPGALMDTEAIGATAPASLETTSGASLATPAAYMPPQRAAFADIDARPLFSPTRRPPLAAPKPAAQPVAAPSKPAAAPPPMTIVLLGVVAGPGQRIAVVKTQAMQTAVVVEVGKIIEGWTVLDIQPDRIVMHAGTVDQTVKLQAHSDGNAPDAARAVRNRLTAAKPLPGAISQNPGQRQP